MCRTATLRVRSGPSALVGMQLIHFRHWKVKPAPTFLSLEVCVPEVPGYIRPSFA